MTITAGGRPRKATLDEKKSIIQIYLSNTRRPAHVVLTEHGIFKKLAEFANSQEGRSSDKELFDYDFSGDKKVRRFMDGLISASKAAYDQKQIQNKYPCPEAKDILAHSGSDLESELDKLIKNYRKICSELEIAQNHIRIYQSKDYDVHQLHLDFGELKRNHAKLQDEYGSLKASYRTLKEEFGSLRKQVGEERKKAAIEQAQNPDVKPQAADARLLLENRAESGEMKSNITNISDIRSSLTDFS